MLESPKNASGEFAAANSPEFDPILEPIKPIFLHNPDGTFCEGIPPGFKEPVVPHRSSDANEQGLGFAEELNTLFTRHEKLFCVLLLVELLIELSYNVMFLYYSGYAVREAGNVYRSISVHRLWVAFWTVYAFETSYIVVYYASGFLAAWKSRPIYYFWFTKVSVVGFLGQVILAYMNRFNLALCVLRCAAYMYSTFLMNILESLMLLPGGHGAAAMNA